MARASLFLLVPLAVLSGCRTPVPIVDVLDQPFATVPAFVTSADVDEAIWRAGRKLSWIIEVRSPGTLRGTLQIRSHMAVVSITHDTRRFSIRYVASTNLGHDRGRIHPNYNVWVEQLAAKIRAEPIVPVRD